MVDVLYDAPDSVYAGLEASVEYVVSDDNTFTSDIIVDMDTVLVNINLNESINKTINEDNKATINISR